MERRGLERSRRIVFDRGGFTLVELLVTLAIIGVVMSIVALAFRAPVAAPADDSFAQALAARRRALNEGRIVTLDIVTDSGVIGVSAHPDGRIVADPRLRVSRNDVAPPPSRQ